MAVSADIACNRARLPHDFDLSDLLDEEKVPSSPGGYVNGSSNWYLSEYAPLSMKLLENRNLRRERTKMIQIMQCAPSTDDEIAQNKIETPSFFNDIYLWIQQYKHLIDLNQQMQNVKKVNFHIDTKDKNVDTASLNQEENRRPKKHISTAETQTQEDTPSAHQDEFFIPQYDDFEPSSIASSDTDDSDDEIQEMLDNAPVDASLTSLLQLAETAVRFEEARRLRLFGKSKRDEEAERRRRELEELEKERQEKLEEIRRHELRLKAHELDLKLGLKVPSNEASKRLDDFLRVNDGVLRNSHDKYKKNLENYVFQKQSQLPWLL